MKKIFVGLLIVASFGFSAYYLFASEKPCVSQSCVQDYEYLAKVRVSCFWLHGGKADRSEFQTSIYRGINTCDAIYLLFNGDYFPARRNNKSTFHGYDVSDYCWYCTAGDRYIFFNY